MQKIKRLKNNSQFKRVAQISGTNIGNTKIWDKFVLKKVTRNNPCDFLNYFKSLKSRRSRNKNKKDLGSMLEENDFRFLYVTNNI